MEEKKKIQQERTGRSRQPEARKENVNRDDHEKEQEKGTGSWE